MNLTQITYFVTVADCASFTKAANILYVSQSSVSKLISDLEHELNLELFTREKGKKLTLTYAGQKLYKDAHNIIENTKQFINTSKNLVNSKIHEKINIGLTYDFDLFKICPNRIQAFSFMYPNIELNFITANERHIIDMLINNQISCFIGTDTLSNHVSSKLATTCINLGPNTLTCITPAEHKYSQTKTFLQNFENETFIFYTDSGIWDITSLRSEMSDLLSLGLSPNYVKCADSLDSLLLYVLLGYGIGVVYTAKRFERHQQLNYIPVPVTTNSNIVICKKLSLQNDNVDLLFRALENNN